MRFDILESYLVSICRMNRLRAKRFVQALRNNHGDEDAYRMIVDEIETYMECD